MRWYWRLAISMALAGWVSWVLMLLHESAPGLLLTRRGLGFFAIAPLFVPYLLAGTMAHLSDVYVEWSFYLGAIAAWYAILPHLVIPPEHTTGYCAVCGYDLRATPDRCPECGTVVEKAIER